MNKNRLGNTNLYVSQLCLGTMTFGEQNDEIEAFDQLALATDYGINFVDTAEMYSVPARAETQGLSEKIVGNWLIRGDNRSRVIIATKATGPSERLGAWMRPLNFRRESIRAALEGSLSRLKTDYVDLYQLHWPERKANFFGKRSYIVSKDDDWNYNFVSVVETMNELIEEGKIKHWGVSNETAWGLMKYSNEAKVRGLIGPVAIQNPYNLLNRTLEVGIAEVCDREEVSLLAYSPLAFGLLTGKYHFNTAHDRSRLRLFKQMDRYSNKRAWKAAKKYIELAQLHGLSPSQMALAYLIQKPFCTSVITGATNITQMSENFASSNLTLTDEVLKEIERIQKKTPNPAP